MADASRKDVPVSPRSTSPPLNLRYSSRSNISDAKQRESMVSLDMTNYSNMDSEEKDKFIEKLKHRNFRAKAKIQALEDANADFWKTIQTQQDLLEGMEKKLDDQETQLKEEKHTLRLKKNASIRKLKHLLDQERGVKAKDGQLSPRFDSDSEKSERNGLRLENKRLRREIQRLKDIIAGSPKVENVLVNDPDHTMEIKPTKTGVEVHKSIQKQGVWLLILLAAIAVFIVTAEVLHSAVPGNSSSESPIEQPASLGEPQ